MVFLTRFLCVPKKIPRKFLRAGFLDSLHLRVKAGTGGMGLARYGGVGGRGGDVVIVATEGLSLHHIAEKYRNRKIIAGHGNDSEKRGIIGQPGDNVEIQVPRGVTIYDSNKTVIGEVDQPNSKLVVARGGIGGCPENGFSGQKGQNHVITLDLKLIADVALVGFPNAGKSTLLRSISNAKPRVADYPFTTIRPNLGIIHYPDLRRITVADLPGLIEGAHVNIGMGHKFLKHLDRTKLLVFIVDIQGFRLSQQHSYRDCLETVILLNKELELYNPDLLDMHAILLVNKMDTPDADAKFKEIESMLRDLSTVIREIPDEIQPERLIEFDEVITTSLIKKNKDEIQMIKDRIRHHLDRIAVEEVKKREDKNVEVELYEKLKSESRTHAPTMV
ncbi:GTP-binding protein 10 homolog [Microplitis mediator]|uniref:GTP-binding protein 10 homolog n=1 Tax=Microplitis mediator TaxID=375433 RepID=UPI002554E18A|nr:GTP-binding protein 10 homolog [Microplitis mediator]